MTAKTYDSNDSRNKNDSNDNAVVAGLTVFIPSIVFIFFIFIPPIPPHQQAAGTRFAKCAMDRAPGRLWPFVVGSARTS
jgi:hypothetical protein